MSAHATCLAPGQVGRRGRPPDVGACVIIGGEHTAADEELGARIAHGQSSPRSGRLSHGMNDHQKTRGSHLVAVLFCLTSLGAASCSQKRPQRLVLITIDTLRLDTFNGRPADEVLDEALDENYPGFSGVGEDRQVSSMPLTAQWAQSAARFDRYFTSSPVTQPAHASMFTGLYPWQHGVTRNGHVLDANHETVAETLRSSGWQTAAVVASYPLIRPMGLGQGFDRYVDELDESHSAKHWNGVKVDKFYSLGETITDRALQSLDGFSEPNQFLWVHYFDPHAPYGDTDRGEKLITMTHLLKGSINAKYEVVARAGIKRALALYEKDVRSLDAQLARLLERLKADEAEFETHVVFVADHGESFGDDDSLGHGRRLTEPQLRTPLIVHSPKATPGLYTDLVGSNDVAATLLALAGSKRSLPNGRDLLSELDRPELVAGMRTTFKGVLKDERVEAGEQKLFGPRWYIVDESGLIAGDRNRAFAADDESQPVDHEGAVRAMKLFGRFADEMRGAVELDDPETRAAMEALGYAGSTDE
ncbi:MAG: arylsulfatase A-like enzyme [Planctomycetota bacterium]